MLFAAFFYTNDLTNSFNNNIYHRHHIEVIRENNKRRMKKNEKVCQGVGSVLTPNRDLSVAYHESIAKKKHFEIG